MDLISIFRAVWRHKLVTIPVILLTCLGAFYVVAIKAPVYEASASFALVYPPAPPTQAQIAADPKLAKINTSNPLLGYSDPSAVTQIVISLVGAPSSQQALVKAGAGTQYQIVPSAGSTQIMSITGVGSTPQAAVLSANLVTQAAKNALHQVQANQGVNPRYMITSYQLVVPNQAAQKLSGKLRSLVAVLGLGVLLLFIGISIAEAIGKGKDKRQVESSTAAGGQMSTGRPYLYSEPDEGLRSSRFRSR
jgi:capsular polysaccharide biosynthesis protein